MSRDDDPRVDILAEALSAFTPLRDRPEVAELYRRDARLLLVRLDTVGRDAELDGCSAENSPDPV